MVLIEDAAEVGIKDKEVSATIRELVDLDRTNVDFQDFFVPRALFAALNLLYGKPLGPDAVLLIELQEAASQPASGHAAPSIDSVRALSTLGKTLIGWYDSRGPFRVFTAEKPDLGLPAHYAVLSVDRLLGDAGKMPALHAYLVVQQDDVPWLEARAGQLRATPGAETLGIASALKVAWRLLAQLRSSANQSGLAAADPLALQFSAPTFNLTGGGYRLLNRAANLLVEFGNIGKQGLDAPWHFCCILVPTSLDVPVQMRDLQVQAASGLSPHPLGTRLSFSETAISLRAYKNGCVISRQTVHGKNADSAFGNLEAGVRSAIAVPVDGHVPEPVAVIYLTSTSPMAFSEDDILLLRIIGRMVGELLNTSWVQQHLAEDLNMLIQKPEVSDSFFLTVPHFGSENEFMRDLDHLTESLRTDANTPGLATSKQPHLVAIDIDGLTSTVGIYGDKAMRNLINKVGRKLANWIGQQSYSVQAYRIWSDRFILLFSDVPLTVVRDAAMEIHRLVTGKYLIDPDALPGGGTGAIPVVIRARLALVPFDTQLLTKVEDTGEVRLILESQLAQALDAGKEQNGNRIMEREPNGLRQLYAGGTADVRES